MKSKREPGRLFVLLARSYLLFTLTLLVIAGSTFLLWNWWLGRLYQPADWDGLLADPALAAGDYESLVTYLPTREDAFAVYGADGVLRYASGEDFDAFCSPQAIAMVPQWGEAVTVDAYILAGEEAGRQLLVRRDYQMGLTDVMVVDQAGRVVFGGFGDGRTDYTGEELLYLSGSRFPDCLLSRWEGEDREGRPILVLLRERIIDDGSYYRRYQQSWKIWLLALPLYLLSVAFFLWWLSRKIGRPLRRLNDAVEAQAEGRLVRVGDCGGAREIRRIGESFDRFSDRLAASEAERRRMDRDRQKMIADISHDLKTPITVIAGYIDAICDGRVPPEDTKRYLKVIQAKAETLTELANAFHEYSKVEHPEFTLHPEDTDLCEYLREYLAGKYDEIDLAGFALEVSIPERPILCPLDRAQFRRVLDNLLSNALRHNRLGTVLFFSVSVREGQAVLRVGDNGAGIPPDRVQNIFDPFVVGSDARTGGGSGLGLAITKRIVEQHGGTVSLAARPSPGWSTEFVVKLPLCRRETALSGPQRS